MKTGVAALFILLSLTLTVASARDAFMSMGIFDAEISRDNQGDDLFMDDNIGPYDLAKVFKNAITMLKDNPMEFSRACLEITRHAKVVFNEESLVKDIDGVASKLCNITSLNLDYKLGSCDACTACRNGAKTLSDMLGDTDRQVIIIIYLLKVCGNQTDAAQCKKKVFTYGPAIMTTLQLILSDDICYMARICEYPNDGTPCSPLAYNEASNKSLI